MDIPGGDSNPRLGMKLTGGNLAKVLNLRKVMIEFYGLKVSMKIAVSVLFLLVFLGCSDGISPELGEEFDLKHGTVRQVSGTTVSLQFQGIDSDSRCPTGAVCKWEGNAEVLLQVSSEELTGVYSLNTTLDPKVIEHNGYLVELISVSPYPVSGKEIADKDYTIRIYVTN